MRLSVPNILTLSRLGVIPFIVAAFFIKPPIGLWIACGLFALASLTDYVDGYLARANQQTSSLGAFLDPIADKLLVASTLLMMVGFGQISGIVIIPAVLILCREILVSGLREYLAELSVKVPVKKLAKWKTMVQMVSIGFLIIGDAAHPMISEVFPVRIIGEIGLFIAATITLITGYDYLRTGLRHMDTRSST